MEVNSPFFYAFKVRSVHITNLETEDVPWTLDGEYGGSDREIDIGVCREALSILVPTDSPALPAADENAAAAQ